MDEIGRAYLILALNLNRHFDGFVDAYFGPAELKTKVEAGEPRPLSLLIDDAYQLDAAIEDSNYDLQRKDFLTGQTRAMATIIHKLSGRGLGFVEEVESCFDITPNLVAESVFEEAHADMDGLLPGDGALVDRLATWRKHLELERDRLLPVLDLVHREIRRRTLALFDLPPEEELSLQLVEGQPWSAYNWYLGNYRSRIDVNTDRPIRADFVVSLLAHEAYPGHHTEHAIKEYRLCRLQDRAEHAVQLLLAPECVLSEGIADNARGMILNDTDLAAFLGSELYPLAGLSQVDPEQQVRLAQASEALHGVAGNAALLLHRDGCPPDEVQQYFERYRLPAPQEAAKMMEFIQSPLFRSYVFNYAMGKALLAPLLEGPAAVANFRRLLSEPFTPTQIRQWIAEQGSG